MAMGGDGEYLLSGRVLNGKLSLFVDAIRAKTPALFGLIVNGE